MTAMSVGLALIGLLIAGLLAWIGLTLSRRKAVGISTSQQEATQRETAQLEAAQLEAAQLEAGAKSAAELVRRQAEEDAAVLRTRAEAAEQRAEEIRRPRRTGRPRYGGMPSSGRPTYAGRPRRRRSRSATTCGSSGSRWSAATTG